MHNQLIYPRTVIKTVVLFTAEGFLSSRKWVQISINRNTLKFALLLGVAFAPFGAAAEKIGVNKPAQSVTADRLVELPAKDRAAWAAYITRSEKQMQVDRNSLPAELKPGETPPPPPLAIGNGPDTMPLDKDAAWYATPEARMVADNIVSFQTPSGGWSKNQNRAAPPRLPGQRYANDAETMTLNTGSFDAPADRFWTFVGAFDNDATTTEMRFLALVQSQLPDKDGEVYRASFIKGVNYILGAQYPNGGWPQIYPLEGGFHDAVTFNDNAIIKVAELLEDISKGKGNFAFVPADLCSKSGESYTHAIDVILASQVVVDGKRTIWPQQVDALTLAPTSARNYEPRSLSSAESSSILVFLMHQPNPTPAIKMAIHDGITWLKDHAIYGKAFTMTPDGRKLIDRPDAGPIWGRMYDIKTGKPIFGDLDKSIYNDVNEISRGRRNGYSWYATTAKKALDVYAKWSETNK